MKTSLSLAFLLAASAIAQEPAAPTTTPPGTTTPAQAAPPVKPGKLNLLSYKAPRATGAAAAERRDGDGASRGNVKLADGTMLTLPNLSVLTPKTGDALTTQAQPSLFTFQTGPSPVEYRVTVTEPGQPKPMFIYAASRSASGIHRVNLAEFDVSLKTGVEYEWSVILRPNPESFSEDLVARGFIKRVAPDAALSEKLKTASPWEWPAVYAEAGIWYDALSAISDQINANPQDKDLLALRASLLEQAKLQNVAKAP